ncbi:MAG TPA: SCO1664 family protein [Thermomicrobiales bacterium]|nr:SCO1664 family protein [Thermomicrobiales bacterium]HQZ89836.1 SCO1664 family protein [Thermomicrobiales bacterium]HRA30906.1 SCO1664 family protein [Thermomicrobiales bacterium]
MTDPRSCSTLNRLRSGGIAECKLVPWGSNYTFAVALTDPDDQDAETLLAIYKPRAGEAPLWDFPSGTLYQREYAAYLLADALGWDFIPPTVIRDGPHGIGTVQLYIEPEHDSHYFSFRDSHQDELRRMAVFDLVANNADRKAGHCFRDRAQTSIWGIDHGLTFNIEQKVRTVIWDFCGEEIPEDLAAGLRRVRDDATISALLAPQLDPLEIQALRARAARLLEDGVFPELTSRRNIPYGW